MPLTHLTALLKRRCALVCNAPAQGPDLLHRLSVIVLSFLTSTQALVATLLTPLTRHGGGGVWFLFPRLRGFLGECSTIHSPPSLFFFFFFSFSEVEIS